MEIALVFKVIDFASDKVAALGESIIASVGSVFGKLFKKKIKEMEEDEDE